MKERVLAKINQEDIGATAICPFCSKINFFDFKKLEGNACAHFKGFMSASSHIVFEGERGTANA